MSRTISRSDGEDETVKETKRLTDRVKELEKSLATKTKESVEVDEEKKEAVKENKRLMDRVKGLEESLATKTEENVKLGEEKELLEEDSRQLKEERGQVEGEKKTVQEVKTKVEEERFQVEKDKVQVEEEKVKVEEERVKVEEERVKVEEERVKVEEERVKVEKMSKEQLKLVECPVCLALPREDRAVPCCPQGHFVCSPCNALLTRQGKLDCPTCRVAMGQGQSLLALTVVKNAWHECKLQGCNVSLPFDQIKEHEEMCIWRLIICPGDGQTCTAMLPYCTVLTHVKNCSACAHSSPVVFQLSRHCAEMNASLTLDAALAFNGRGMTWKTKILQLEQGFVFFVRLSRREGIFTIDVVMKGRKEDCREFMVEASILDAVSGPMFKATFQPRPLSNQNEAVYCLSVSEKAVSQVWKHDVLRKKYQIDYLVKVVKLD